MNALQLAIREAEAKFRNGRSHPCKARTPYTFVDLFAGVGGFHLALADLGMKCVAACENNPQARQTYAANFDVNCFPDDITHVDPAEIPDADIICGGFPCQPFSIAGTQAGFAHAEGNLFFNVLGIIQAKRPRVPPRSMWQPWERGWHKPTSSPPLTSTTTV